MIFILFLLLVSIFFSSAQNITDTNTPSINYPYLVIIQTENYDEEKNLFMETLCGGTIINPSWILTAANCVCDAETCESKSCSHLIVVAGTEHNVKIHVDYCVFDSYKEISVGDNNLLSSDNDIALLKLNKSFVFDDNIKSLEYIKPDMGISKRLQDQNCIAVGWDLEKIENENHTEYVQQQIDVILILPEQCSSSKLENKLRINDKQICTFHEAFKSMSCKLNAGGPVICDSLMVAILGRATSCAQESLLINCRIDKYHDWIESSMTLTLRSSSNRLINEHTYHLLLTSFIWFIFRTWFESN